MFNRANKVYSRKGFSNQKTKSGQNLFFDEFGKQAEGRFSRPCADKETGEGHRENKRWQMQLKTTKK